VLVGKISSRSLQWYAIGAFMIPFGSSNLTPKLGSQTIFERLFLKTMLWNSQLSLDQL